MQGQLQYKEAFILFFQGEQLRNKVIKICEGYARAFAISHATSVYGIDDATTFF
jgi:phage/plasmid primase-like uncharacterized protein